MALDLDGDVFGFNDDLFEPEPEFEPHVGLPPPPPMDPLFPVDEDDLFAYSDASVKGHDVGIAFFFLPRNKGRIIFKGGEYLRDMGNTQAEIRAVNTTVRTAITENLLPYNHRTDNFQAYLLHVGASRDRLYNRMPGQGLGSEQHQIQVELGNSGHGPEAVSFGHRLRGKIFPADTLAKTIRKRRLARPTLFVGDFLLPEENEVFESEVYDDEFVVERKTCM